MSVVRTLGPIVSEWAFERVARDLLVADRNLIGLYVDEINRQADSFAIKRVERPRSVKVRWKASRFSDDQLPAIVIVNAGTVGESNRDGAGLYTATWQLVVSAVSQSSGEDVAREVASDLCCAATAVLVQMLPRVDDRIIGAVWSGAATADVDVDGEERSRCIFARGVQVTVQDVLCDLGGVPADWDVPDPPLDGSDPVDPGAYLPVLTTEVTVTPVEELT